MTDITLSVAEYCHAATLYR